jgi:hypothetical protein
MSVGIPIFLTMVIKGNGTRRVADTEFALCCYAT